LGDGVSRFDVALWALDGARRKYESVFVFSFYPDRYYLSHLPATVRSSDTLESAAADGETALLLP
jgi:hypothetical protein